MYASTLYMRACVRACVREADGYIKVVCSCVYCVCARVLCVGVCVYVRLCHQSCRVMVYGDTVVWRDHAS